MNKVRLLKTPLMLLALIAVIYTMRQLNTKGLDQGVLSTLGIQPSGAPLVPGAAEPAARHARLIGQITWCETRVRELEEPGVFRLYQDGSKWFFDRQGQKKEVDFVAVEKWFARHCSLHVEAAAVSAQQTLHPGLVVKFVRGPDQTFERAEGSGTIYRWRNQTFKSPELDMALSLLGDLPSPRPPNQG